MDQLWAPWRLAYVTLAKPANEEATCFLCAGLGGTDDRAALIVERTGQSIVVLNRYPYNNGHLLVAPQAHKGRLDELTPAECHDVHDTIRRMVRLLERILRPEGFNIGLNLGRAAGAGLPEHLHWHIVPRWNGDTNFMPVVADVKVIPQALDALYDLLIKNLAGEASPAR